MKRAALSLLLWLPCAARAASVDTDALRPLAVDLRPLYQRHNGTRYRPVSGFLAAPVPPAKPAAPRAAKAATAGVAALEGRGRVGDRRVKR